jgi:flagellar export protein FliJ
MKAYKFRFEKVLKTKKIVVDQLASKTARARKILLLEKRKLEDIRERQARCVTELALLQTGAVDTAEVQRCHRYLQLLGEADAEQQDIIKEIDRRVEMLRGMLHEAEKQRQIFEKLDEKERAKFLDEFQRQERLLLDEVGIERFVRRSAHGRNRASGR